MILHGAFDIIFIIFLFMIKFKRLTLMGQNANYIRISEAEKIGNIGI